MCTLRWTGVTANPVEVTITRPDYYPVINPAFAVRLRQAQVKAG